MTPTIDDLVAASAFFGGQVVQVGDEQWGDPTPCDEWTVSAVVSHVVVQDSQVREILTGGRIARVVQVDESILGHSPAGVWRGTALAAIDAFRADGVLERSYDHPLGEVSGQTLLGFRVLENLVHGWDVATACGREVAIDEGLADLTLEFFAPWVESFRASGHFGTSPSPVDPGAPASERLLAFAARRA